MNSVHQVETSFSLPGYITQSCFYTVLSFSLLAPTRLVDRANGCGEINDRQCVSLTYISLLGIDFLEHEARAFPSRVRPLHPRVLTHASASSAQPQSKQMHRSGRVPLYSKSLGNSCHEEEPSMQQTLGTVQALPIQNHCFQRAARTSAKQTDVKEMISW